jgi:hypothetical protein
MSYRLFLVPGQKGQWRIRARPSPGHERQLRELPAWWTNDVASAGLEGERARYPVAGLAHAVQREPRSVDVVSLYEKVNHGREDLLPVARELYVTRSTVAFHLSNAYAKTGTTSRHELVQLVRAA